MAKDKSLTGQAGLVLNGAREALTLAYPDAQERAEVLRRCPLPRTVSCLLGVVRRVHAAMVPCSLALWWHLLCLTPACIMHW